MHPPARVLIGVILLLSLTACAPAAAFPGPIPTTAGRWSLRFTQTGGFAGVNLLMQLSSEGRMTAEDGRSGKVATRELPPGTMEQISGLLPQTRIPSMERLPSACADCFIYQLEITSTTGTVRITADDTNLMESGAQPLVRLLSKIRDEALRAVD